MSLAEVAKFGKSSPQAKANKISKCKRRPSLVKEEEEIDAYEGIHGLTPKKPNGNNILYYNIFPEAKDDKMKLLGDGISSLKNNSTSKMQFATIYRNHKEMKIHQSHPLYKIARKEELNRLQHIEEFSKVQSIAEEIAIKEIKGEDEATLGLLEQLQKEEDEENRREAEMAARRRKPRTRSKKKEVKGRFFKMKM